MTEVLFYHLEQQPLEKVLPTLVERTLQRGWRAVVQVVKENLGHVASSPAGALVYCLQRYSQFVVPGLVQPCARDLSRTALRSLLRAGSRQHVPG